LRVLITGASGLLGGALCDALLARGDEVVGLTRDPGRARRGNPTVRWHAWDATIGPVPDASLEDVDAVVNLVGESLDQRWTRRAKQRILDTRERGTRSVVEAIGARKDRPKVMVSQSAVGYYGDRGDAVVDEGTAPGEDFAARVCIAWEAAAREVESHKVRLAIFRTSPVLSREGGLLKRLLPPFRMGLGGPIGSGEQYLPWIHIDDEVRALLWALDEKRVSGIFNAASPAPVTNREFSKALGRTLGRPAALRVPGPALAVVLGRELARTVIGGQRVLPRRALDAGFEFRFPELGPALSDVLG
jgi:uncharacterized protein (TIGR01777 family)